LAPHSTIEIASLVPATRRSRSELSIWSNVGLTINLPSMRPILTAPTGPSHGISEIVNAAEAALIPRISIGLIPSEENETIMTCTGLRMSFGNNGRSGRSVNLASSTASVLGLPSLRKNEPGIRPPAYILSS